MNHLSIAASVAVFVATPLLAQQGDSVEATDSQAAAIVADCNARKFESSVEIDKGGEKRLTRFKLCAAKDSDDAAWVKTLKDAKAKIAAHPDISAESKASIAKQLDIEIAKYPAALTASAPPPAAVTPSVVVTPPPSSGTSDAAVAPTAKPALKKPRLTVRCLDPGESGAGSSCSLLDRTTRLLVSADADLAGGASLRFLRRGDQRAEIALAQMHQGEQFRTKLPSELCAGVASTQVQIQVVNSNQVVETLGPYKLRC